MKKNFLLKSLIFSLLLSVSASFNVLPVNAEELQQPDIVAQSALTMDYDTGEVIYCKDADTKRYPASTTKLLTGLLLAENKEKADMLTYTEAAKAQPPFSINNSFMHDSMQVGDKITADDIMKGLMLFSGNDAAYVVSDNVGGDVQGFAQMMNQKAEELGAENSHFTNPNGLHDDNHYTTAYDLALIMKAAYANDWEQEVMAMPKCSININGSTLLLENRNISLGKNGCVSGKTGHTDPAGGCLATVYERDGRKIVGVVLKSEQVDLVGMPKFEDMEKIMDYSFSQTKTVYKEAGDEAGTINLKYKPFFFFGPEKEISVPLKLNSNIEYYPNEINDSSSEISCQESDKSAWNVLFNHDVNLSYTERNHSETVPGTAQLTFGDMFKQNIILYVGVIAALIIILTLVIMIVRMLRPAPRRNRKRRRR